MKDINTHNRLIDWIDQLASKGKTSFSIEELRAAFPENSEISLNRSVNRLFKKNKNDKERTPITFINLFEFLVTGKVVFLSRCKQQIAPNQNSTCLCFVKGNISDFSF